MQLFRYITRFYWLLIVIKLNPQLTHHQGSPHIVKTGRLDFSLSWLKGEVRENLGDFRKSIQILTFLSPLPHVPLPFTKTNNDLKRMQLTSLEKNTNLKRLTGRLKLRFLTEIGWLHWNQGEEVAHFAWFGEPCNWHIIQQLMFYCQWVSINTIW
jgi:hypothetical protein